MFHWFERLSVAKKLIFAAGSLIVLLMAASTLSSINSYRAQGALEDLSRNAQERALTIRSESEVFEGRMATWRSLGTGDPKFWDTVDKSFAGAVADLKQLLDLTHSPEQRAKTAAILSRFDEYLKISLDTRRLGAFAEANKDADSRAVMDKGGRAGAEIVDKLRDLERDYSAAAEETQQRLKDEARLALTATVGLAVASLAVAIGLAFITIRGIRRPIVEMTTVTAAIARGDLGAAVPHSDERNEVGDLARAVEVLKANAQEKLRLEAEAASARAAADVENARQAAEKAGVAEERTNAMQALGKGLRQLADGDLTVRLDDNFPKQFAQVRDDFNHAAEKLMHTVRGVVDSTGAIRSGTQEISSASDNLSARTEQQAASLEETAAALDEITSTLKKSAEGARHAAQVVGAADADAKSGAVVVRQAVEAMDAIAKSSRQIGQIIGVIDEIAFQTNLLALNAGVEAARAGDAGRGFAVVAMEVRGLAQRSADAAKEIKGLISTSATQVDSGVKLVAETGKALERIITQVSEINNVVADIAAGAQEQATGLQQVNSAINQMDQSTQQNATMVEESTAASHSLTQETSQLASLVDQFRLGGGDSADAALRRSLQKAAPHAFAKPAAPRPAPPARRAAKPATVSAAAAAPANWSEF